MHVFNHVELKNLYKPPFASSKNQNGLVTIIGGSRLFHGAPLLSVKVASRIVDMVFFTSPEASVGGVADKIKSKLLSFIWVPWEEAGDYIQKSDADLIGPGLMRYSKEKDSALTLPKRSDDAWQETHEITRDLLLKYPDKKWVIDAGSLQVLDAKWIPPGAILTPNKKEYERLFNEACKMINDKWSEETVKNITANAKKYKCVIVLKGPETLVVSETDACIVKGGNPGLTKGGTGDIVAGLTAAFFAKNEAFLAASAASYFVKKAADDLFAERGTMYNSDDLADKIPVVFTA